LERRVPSHVDLQATGPLLDYASELDRSLAFIVDLMAHGEERADFRADLNGLAPV
jgi:hypothetical protein